MGLEKWPDDFHRGMVRSQQGEVCCGNIFPEKTRRQHVGELHRFFSWRFLMKVTRKNHQKRLDDSKRRSAWSPTETVAAALSKIGLDHWIIGSNRKAHMEHITMDFS
jgi:hypothetical protein